jgi:hypothetical protein
VTIDTAGNRVSVPPLILDTEDEKRKAVEAEARRAERLKAKKALEARTALDLG